MGDAVIKTTARFQEANEPNRQRPIIRIDPAISFDASGDLPNTIRDSIGSGRDNPFRPDGKIYRSADPIVDYYKNGPNQSRGQSPAEGLLADGKGKGKSSSSSSKRRKEGRESCWSRWFRCCCCCGCFRSGCCSKRDSQITVTQVQNGSSKADVLGDDRSHLTAKAGAVDSGGKKIHSSKMTKQTKQVALKDHNSWNSTTRAKSNGTMSSSIAEFENSHHQHPH